MVMKAVATLRKATNATNARTSRPTQVHPLCQSIPAALEPLVGRASEFLEAEMDSGHMRRHEPRLLLLAIYSTVIGMLTEVELLRALGEEPTARSLVRRRAEILDLLRSALVTVP